MTAQSPTSSSPPPVDLPAHVRALIERLELQPHPEGGYFRETHRSPRIIPASALPAEYAGDRCAVTSIFYLLASGSRSRAHRVRSEEIWLHQQGDQVQLRIGEAIDDQGEVSKPEGVTLGQGRSAALQAVVPAGAWQEAESLAGEHGYALLACIVAPGFEFADFQMADEPQPSREEQP